MMTGANANAGGQTEVLLPRLVIQPPLAERRVAVVEAQSLPQAQADGA